MPNITTVDNLQGETKGYEITASTQSGATTHVLNGIAASDASVKVNSLMIANKDTTTAADIDVCFYDSSANSSAGAEYTFVSGLSIPVGATLDVLASHVYLNNGDYLAVKTNSATAVTVLGSYERLETVS
tara:strand:+ start:125 stop:514 length:390 start_codon:yes stop_codon:yes gene_type:complete